MKKLIPWRLFSQILAVQTISVLLGLSATGLSARYFFKDKYLHQVEKQLQINLASLAPDLPPAPDRTWCTTHSIHLDFQLSLLNLDGTVICKSQQDLGEHPLQRSEVTSALRNSYGTNIYFAANPQDSMLFGALRIENRNFILLGSIPLTNLADALQVMDLTLGFFLIIMAILMGIFAYLSVRRIVFPIGRLLLKAQNVAKGDLERAFSDDSDASDFSENPIAELSDLEISLDHIRSNLEEKSESLQQEREEHAILMGAISDAILAVNPSGSPLFYNSKFAILMGKEVKVSALSLIEIVRSPEILAAFQLALKEAKASTIPGVKLFPESGNHFFSVSVSPLLRTISGEVYGAVGIFHDINELKLAEQMRIDFVANVSHELRTPLTSIKGYTETLILDIDEGRSISKDFLLVIQKNSNRLYQLIQDLLNLSALESQAEESQLECLKTRNVTERIGQQMGAVFSSRKQMLKITIEAEEVWADPRQLEQVLTNLLDNASKYSPENSAISVRWLRENNFIILRVKDEGPGIPEEHHARLFERFYRVDKARSRELGGTGLGLAIVKHIMLGHHGNVRIESSRGNGSCFICSFPLTPKTNLQGIVLASEN